MPTLPCLPDRTRRTSAGLVLALAIAGCVVVPGGDTPGRGHVDAASISALRAGLTSRADVLMALGDPDQRRLDDRVFGYLWHELVAALLYGSQFSGEIDLTRRRLLLIEFDAQGLLRRMDVVEGIRDRTLTEAVDAWLAGVADQRP